MNAIDAKADNQAHIATKHPTVSSHRVWIIQSVSMIARGILRSIAIDAKADNRVHFADKRRIVLSKLIWIHRMPSVADPYPESVNGEYSVRFLL